MSRDLKNYVCHIEDRGAIGGKTDMTAVLLGFCKKTLIMNVPKYTNKQLKVFQRCSLGILSVNCFAALWNGSRQDFFGKAEIINAIKPFFTVLSFAAVYKVMHPK